MSVTKAGVSVLFPMLKVFSMTKKNFSAYQSLIENTSVRSWGEQSNKLDLSCKKPLHMILLNFWTQQTRMLKHSCIISTGVSQMLRIYQDSKTLSRQQREPGLDADTKDLPNPAPSEHAELAFKGTTGPRL